MKDETLERVWKSRAAISTRCGFDARQLVTFYQQRGKKKKKRTIYTVGEEKLYRLEKLLKEEPIVQNQKLIICCRFKHGIIRIGEVLD